MMTYYLKEMEQVVPAEMYLMAKQQRWDLFLQKDIYCFSDIIYMGIQAEENLFSFDYF